MLDLERLGIPGPGDPGRDWLSVSLKNAKYVLQYVNILLQTYILHEFSLKIEMNLIF